MAEIGSGASSTLNDVDCAASSGGKLSGEVLWGDDMVSSGGMYVLCARVESSGAIMGCLLVAWAA